MIAQAEFEPRLHCVCDGGPYYRGMCIICGDVAFPEELTGELPKLKGEAMRFYMERVNFVADARKRGTASLKELARPAGYVWESFYNPEMTYRRPTYWPRVDWLEIKARYGLDDGELDD